jgi:Fur family ferric uptake transcriptional regulator
MTSSRSAILEALQALDDHFAIEPFIERLKNSGFLGSRATVYATVKLLVEQGILRRMTGMNRDVFYEWVADSPHHDHLICEGCGKTFVFTNETIERLQEKICQTFEFSPKHHNLTIFGYCKDCQEIPLTQAPEGQAMKVARITGDDRHQLRRIGIVKGADVKVVRRLNRGPWVIQVQDAKIAVDPKLLSHLWVKRHET